MIVVIPARYASTRLPGKPLVDIKGKTLVERVYDCAQHSNAGRIIIATDDKRIEAAAKDFGAEVCMTSEAHTSGTERLSEVIEKLSIAANEIVVNLQGDEPLMPGSLINQVSNTLEHSDAPMATACHKIEDQSEAQDPHVVKVVFDQNHNAIYFSRACIPFVRNKDEHSLASAGIYYRHIGIYAYRADFIKRYVSWPQSELEKLEALEQLRVLWHGESIAVCEAKELPGPGVDTAEDLQRVLQLV